MKITIFGGIEGYMPISSIKYKLSILNELRKYNITIKEYSIQFVNTYFLKGIFNRYFLYTYKARKHCSEINHILDQPNACLINFFPKESKSIVVCHDIIPLLTKSLSNYPFKIFSQQGILKADKIIASSLNTKKDLIKFLNIKESKINVVYPGVNHNVFIKREIDKNILGFNSNQKIIIHVGSEEARKNVVTIIKSLNLLQKSIHNFIFIRVGPKTKEVSTLIKKFGMDNKVLYYNNLSDYELSLFYNAADLLVFPSFYEGFGLPPLEAMTCGCPVVTSNTSSLPEVVGDAGIMIDPNDIDGLAKAIYRVITDKDLRESMVKKGLKRAKKFNWEKTAEETLKVYKECYSKR